MSQCTIPGCFYPAGNNDLNVCKACDYLMRHPEIDDPDAILQVIDHFNDRSKCSCEGCVRQ